MSMGNPVNMYIYIYVFFLRVSAYVHMCRPVYVYEHDCFMYVPYVHILRFFVL